MAVKDSYIFPLHLIVPVIYIQEYKIWSFLFCSFLNSLNAFVLRKVAGLITDQIIWITNLANPSNHTMTLVSTHPLSEMGTRNLPAGRTAICEPNV
jgi:hypothetical protein